MTWLIGAFQQFYWQIADYTNPPYKANIGNIIAHLYEITDAERAIIKGRDG